jgi:hypothetical protein
MLLLVSVAPALGVALAAGSLPGNPGLAAAGNVGWLFGTAHVALTGFLWFDRRYRAHINDQPMYFYAVPAALTLACLAAVYLTGAAGLVVFSAAFTAWLLYHFGRQNWGVLCLAAAGTRSGPATALERQICHWAPVAGVAGVLSAPGEMLHTAGLAAMLAIGAATLAACVQHVRGGAPFLRTAMTAIVGLFFLPVYLLPQHAIPVIGVAHAYQYALVMGCLAAGRQTTAVRLWVLPLAALTAIYIAAYIGIEALLRVAGPATAAMALVAWQMVIVWHFLIDADVWRLSRPFQRQAVRESLPFLFSR